VQKTWTQKTCHTVSHAQSTFARRLRRKNRHQGRFVGYLGDLGLAETSFGARFSGSMYLNSGFPASSGYMYPSGSLVPRAGMEAAFKSRRRSAGYPPTNGSGGGKKSEGKGASRCPARSFSAVTRRCCGRRRRRGSRRSSTRGERRGSRPGRSARATSWS
jgi:hypothetical protein